VEASLLGLCSEIIAKSKDSHVTNCVSLMFHVQEVYGNLRKSHAPIETPGSSTAMGIIANSVHFWETNLCSLVASSLNHTAQTLLISNF